MENWKRKEGYPELGGFNTEYMFCFFKKIILS